jgi:hypothetical protein
MLVHCPAIWLASALPVARSVARATGRNTKSRNPRVSVMCQCCQSPIRFRRANGRSKFSSTS